LSEGRRKRQRGAQEEADAASDGARRNAEESKLQNSKKRRPETPAEAAQNTKKNAFNHTPFGAKKRGRSSASSSATAASVFESPIRQLKKQKSAPVVAKSTKNAGAKSGRSSGTTSGAAGSGEPEQERDEEEESKVGRGQRTSAPSKLGVGIVPFAESVLGAAAELGGNHAGEVRGELMNLAQTGKRGLKFSVLHEAECVAATDAERAKAIPRSATDMRDAKRQLHVTCPACVGYAGTGRKAHKSHAHFQKKGFTCYKTLLNEDGERPER
jgi:hypothetical protein